MSIRHYTDTLYVPESVMENQNVEGEGSPVDVLGSTGRNWRSIKMRPFIRHLRSAGGVAYCVARLLAKAQLKTSR
jgi:hypothetical protein